MKSVTTILIFMLIAPLNLVAASAMQVDLASAGHSMAMEHGDGQDHSLMHADAQMQSMMESHDHSAEDCDEYCMSCSNHCSSTAIVSGSPLIFDLTGRFARASGADLETRAYLLFRPPIRG